MDGNLSASDVALLDNRGGFGDGFMGIFGLLILLGILNGGFGGWGGNNRGDYATSEAVNTTAQFGQLLDGNRDISNQVTTNAGNIISALGQSQYETINVVKDAQSQLQDRLADISVAQRDVLASINQCCGNVRLEMANMGASINANTTAQTQKILDAIATNRMADMQSQINQLQLAQATAGMMRFPNQWTFAGGFFPPMMPPMPTTATSGTTTTG